MRLFTKSCRGHPSQLTEQDLTDYCAVAGLSNNTIYSRITRCRTFMRWCERQGLLNGPNPGELIGAADSPLRRSYKRSYGKTQARYPGRWLSYEEAYEQLVAFPVRNAVDLRDAVVIRLGLVGMRRSEITALTVRSVSDLPRIVWTGKGRRVRRATAGAILCQLVEAYLRVYRASVPGFGQGTPLICPAKGGNGRVPEVRWGVPAGRDCVYRIVRTRADSAGLGHLATHDLRRTAAGILHNSVTDEGGHRFDLLDIQRILGHADPATTMRCYLEPLDTSVLDRAAEVLD